MFWDSFVNLLNARTPIFYLHCINLNLVLPIVEYGNVIWGPTLHSGSVELEHIQCKATRIIPSLHGLPYNDRLKNLCLATLSSVDGVEVI